jgi:hypothetical protein
LHIRRHIKEILNTTTAVFLHKLSVACFHTTTRNSYMINWKSTLQVHFSCYKCSPSKRLTKQVIVVILLTSIKVVTFSNVAVISARLFRLHQLRQANIWGQESFFQIFTYSPHELIFLSNSTRYNPCNRNSVKITCEPINPHKPFQNIYFNIILLPFGFQRHHHAREFRRNSLRSYFLLIW